MTNRQFVILSTQIDMIFEKLGCDKYELARRIVENNKDIQEVNRLNSGNPSWKNPYERGPQ